MTTATENKLKPGIYRNVDFPAYLKWDCPSHSVLKAGRESAMHMKAAIESPVTVASDEMLLGSALHTCFLEPEYMSTRVVEWTGARRYGAIWDDFCETHEGKIILTTGLYDRLVGMVQSLRKHPFTRNWTAQIEHCEVSAVGEIAGVLCKGRADAITNDPLVDIKSCRSNSERDIRTAIHTLGYHIQAATYRRLFNRERFVLLTVENHPPYRVGPIELDDMALRVGDQELLSLVGMYKYGVESGEWPGGYEDDSPVLTSLPDWVMESRAANITIGGETAFN